MTSEIVDTKLEAFKLITDPTRLFSLIFSSVTLYSFSIRWATCCVHNQYVLMLILSPFLKAAQTFMQRESASQQPYHGRV